MTTWNDLFEASPADGDEAKYGASKIRELKVAIREREELEHNFAVGVKPFHKAGKCAVFFSGTTTEINALSGMPEGSIAFDTTVGVLQRFNGSTWVTQILAHGQLTDLDVNVHPQYLHLTTVGQTITEDIAVTAGKTIDGRDISDDMSKFESLIKLETSSLALVFDSASKEIRRSVGSFVTDGFAERDIIHTTSADNPGPFQIDTVTATIITVVDVINDAADTSKVLVINVGFEDWSGSYSKNTTYGPETRDCFISAIGDTKTSNTGVLRGFVGITAADTMIQVVHANYSYSVPIGLTFPVRRGSYWKVTSKNTDMSSITRMQVG